MGAFTSSTTRWSIPFLESSEFRERLGEEGVTTAPWALVILNTPVSRELLDLAWNFCAIRYCADGGANRLLDVLNEEDRASHIPNLIKGDLDSIRPDTRQYYAAKGVPIVEDSSQYATDLMKCVDSLSELEKQEGIKYNVLLLGGLAGRLDQTAHTMSYLLKQRQKRPYLMAITEESLAWVLDAGDHYIRVDRSLLGPTCGLLPVGVTSTRLTIGGFEWNLDDAESAFDGMVSTSNHVAEDTVFIRTTEPIIWTVALKPLI